MGLPLKATEAVQFRETSANRKCYHGWLPLPRGGPAGHLQENGLPERALCSTDLELLWKLGH